MLRRTPLKDRPAAVQHAQRRLAEKRRIAAVQARRLARFEPGPVDQWLRILNPVEIWYGQALHQQSGEARCMFDVELIPVRCL